MITRLLLLLLLAASPTLFAQSDVARTVHNLTPEGPGAMKEQATTGLCVFCHTPHNGNPARSMWNRETPGISYQLYSSSTLRANLKQPTGSSRLCLSCHDGFVAMGNLDLGFALVLVLVINTVIFLISPWITDLMLKWVNQVVYLDDDTLKARYPHVHAIIHDVARERGFTAPSVGIIPDRNPTAFTYGLFRSNARIVLTEGIFEFLNEEETRAVVAGPAEDRHLFAPGDSERVAAEAAEDRDLQAVGHVDRVVAAIAKDRHVLTVLDDEGVVAETAEDGHVDSGGHGNRVLAVVAENRDLRAARHDERVGAFVAEDRRAHDVAGHGQ